MGVFEKEGETLLGPEPRSRWDRNWENGNKKFDVQDKRIAELGETNYPGSNEVTQARTGLDGTSHSALTGRLDDMEKNTDDLQDQIENMEIRANDQDNKMQTAVNKLQETDQEQSALISSTEDGVTATNNRINDTNELIKSIASGDYKGPSGSGDLKPQAVQIGQLMTGMQNDFGVKNEVNITFEAGLWSIDGTENLHDDAKKKYRHGEIAVRPGDIFFYTAKWPSAVQFALAVDAKGKVLQTYKDKDVVDDMQHRNSRIAIPVGATKLHYNALQGNNYTPKMSRLGYMGDIKSRLLWLNYPLSFTKNTYIGSQTNVNYPNQLVTSSGIKDNYQVSDLFKVVKGTVLTIQACISANAYVLAEFSSNGNLITGLITGDNKTKEYTFKADHDMYLRVGNNTELLRTPRVATTVGGSGQGGVVNSAMSGKVINMLGDSYVANNADPVTETWHYKMAKKYGMVYNNYGQNGNGMVTDKANGDPMISRYGQMGSADYVIVIGGKNDYNQQISLDNFKTGVDNLITGLSAKYPNAKIAFMTPWNNQGHDGNRKFKLNQYSQVIEDECLVYGIPCFNSSKQSGVRVWDEGFRKKYMQSDSDVSHLNPAGHDYFEPRGEAFIAGL